MAIQVEWAIDRLRISTETGRVTLDGDELFVLHQWLIANDPDEDWGHTRHA